MNMIQMSHERYTVHATCVKTGITTPVEYLTPVAPATHQACQWCGLTTHLYSVGIYRFCAACQTEAME